jgi:hypothetical protein
VDRTNISILIATALLGVLLYVVRQIGDTGLAAVTPPPRQADPAVAAAGTTRVVAAPQTTESALPIVDGASSLASLLDDLGLNGSATVDEARRWYEARGFIGANPLLGADPDSGLPEYYQSLDDTTLKVMSESRDVGATHELAARAKITDPFAALELLRLAADQGSINALLQIATLQETLADVRPDDFMSDPDYASNLARAGGRNPDVQLRIAAMTNALTALRDGGAPVADRSLLQWINRLAEALPADLARGACNLSVAQLLNLSSTRRRLGAAPVTTSPPPVFLSHADFESELPCGDTLNPVTSNLDLSNCAATEVLDGRGSLRLLYVCLTN